MSGRDLLLAVVVFGSIPFILARPYLGVLEWVWLAFMNPHFLAWGFARHFPWAEIVAGTLLVGIVFSREPKRIPWNAITVTMLVFLAWMCLTTYMSLRPEPPTHRLELVAKMFLMVFVTMVVMQDRLRLQLLVGMIGLSIGFYGAKGGVFTILTGGHYRVLGPDRSFMGDNNILAWTLVMALPLLFYAYQQLPWRKARWGMIAVMGSTVIAVFGSYSRTAIVAGAAMCVFLFLRRRQKFLLVTAGIVLLPVLISFMPVQWSNRMETITNPEEDPSFMGRVNAWHFAINLANDRPLLGGGFRVFTPAMFERYAPDPSNVHDAHSIYFQTLGEQGYVGLFLFLLLGWLAWRSAGRVIRTCAGREDLHWAGSLAATIQASLVAFFVGGLTLGWTIFELYYYLVAIAVITHRVVEREIRSEALRAAAEEPETPEATPAHGARLGG